MKAKTPPLHHVVSGCRRLLLTGGLASLLAFPFETHAQSEPTTTYKILMQDILINADLWSNTPEILSAGYGFEGIIGVPGNKDDVLAAGAAWLDLPGYDNPPMRAQTAAMTPNQVASSFGYPVNYADAMPIVFSWPVLPSTATPEAFRVVLNNGETVNPQVVSISPNLEYNERNTVVIFGEFGNRLTPGTDGAIYPVRVEIVETAKPMQLVGPQGPVSAVGLMKTSTNPYIENGGPTLVGAKLTTMSISGEGAPAIFSSALPNHGVALYGDDAQFRLRILTTGGFSPNGVSSVLPTDFEKFFRLRLNDVNLFGENITMILDQVGVTYVTSRGEITIIGLADLGPLAGPYDLVYQEDHDNQIDIILKGDKAAMELITFVEIPVGENHAVTGNPYQPFYNPGGPGTDPVEGVTYTQPGPYTLQAVSIELDNPNAVTYMVPEPSIGLLGALAGGVFWGAKRLRNRRKPGL